MEDIEALKKEVESLKNSNSIKSDLISISSHQLRTSLSALKWIFQMFLDKDLGPISQEQESFLKKASESNERMIVLVNDMLTLNHTEDNALSFKASDVNVLSIIDQTLFEFSGESNKKQIDIIFLRPEYTIPIIKCDPELLRAILQNLIENSIKYSQGGDKILISTREIGDSIEISVHDKGIGIEQEDRGHIFEKFFRAENAKTKEPIGSGLGLFTIKKILEHYNGKIWFESNKDTGTTFFFSLPIK